MAPSPAHLRRGVLALPFCAVLAVTSLATADHPSLTTLAAAPPTGTAPAAAWPAAAVPGNDVRAITDLPSSPPPATAPAHRTGKDVVRQARAAFVPPASPTTHRAQPGERPSTRTTTTTTRAKTTATTSTKPASTTHAPSGTSHSSMAYAVLSQLNSERAKHGAQALRMNSDLISSAHAHNLQMAKYNQMSHQLPGEASLGTRISRTGYNWHYAGENIGWNSQRTTSGALALETMMYDEGPGGGHYENIVNKNFRDVGIDVYIAGGKLWLTVDFGG